MTDIAPRELARRYVAAWNEPDAVRRRAAIQGLWAEDGAHVLQPPQEIREAAARVSLRYLAAISVEIPHPVERKHLWRMLSFHWMRSFHAAQSFRANRRRTRPPGARSATWPPEEGRRARHPGRETPRLRPGGYRTVASRLRESCQSLAAFRIERVGGHAAPDAGDERLGFLTVLDVLAGRALDERRRVRSLKPPRVPGRCPRGSSGPVRAARRVPPDGR